MNKVAIVGCSNVGKSTFFNFVLGKRKAIVSPKAGTTRDYIYGICEWLNQKFVLIDTGGLFTKNDFFTQETTLQVTIALKEANLIIFLVDGQKGVTSDDQKIAKMLQNQTKPVIIVVNKIDSTKHLFSIHDFWSLGFGQPFFASAIHGLGVGDILDQVVKKLPFQKITSQFNGICFVIVGRPNVGKSSLANAILDKKRSIVSNLSGTTRDSIDTLLLYKGKKYQIIDTAGIKKRGKINQDLEKYAFLRTKKVILRAHIALLVIDAQTGVLNQDLHIAQILQKHHKGVIIIVNKWDGQVKQEHSYEVYKKMIQNHFKFLTFAPILFLSSLFFTKIHKLFILLNLVHDEMNKYIKTTLLNEVVGEITSLNKPKTFGRGQLNILYANQVGTNPPKVVFFVNNTSYLHFSYKRYLENQLRNYFGFIGTPIILLFRNNS